MVFILSLQDREGDNKLVNIIEDWDVLAEYAGEKLGFYQLLANEGKIEFEFDWKMLAQDILETAKVSQLSGGTFVGVQRLENSAFRYRSSSSP